MRVTVKREENERGLARVCQGPRGFEIRIKGERVGHAMWGRNFGQAYGSGYWFWYAGSERYSVPRKNASDEPFETAEAARDACLAYVRKHAKEPE